MKADTASALGRLVLEARQKRGITQGQLATVSKVSTRTLVALENGRHAREEIRSDVIIRLALGLGKDPDEWLKLLGKESVEMEIDRWRHVLGLATGAIKLSATQVLASWMELSTEDQEKIARMMAAALKMRLTPE